MAKKGLLTDQTDAPRASVPCAEGAADARPVMKDVWSRSGSKYRIRAVALLAVNVLLFAGVGSFAFWLRNGVRFAPASAGYWDELWQTFWSVPLFGRHHAGASLGALLLEPISVQDVPMQILVVGLLMAALISVPILTALLYRFWSSVPFIAVVGLLAVMPWLAVTLSVSCLIACSRILPTRYRFTSALLALVPAVIYLILAWSGTTDLVAGRIDPVDRMKFIAPWVFAIVAAALVFAIVLAIAKVVDYRPGAITPLLALMFGLPVALFEFNVGRDELYYRLLEARSDKHFADYYASKPLEQAVREEWERHPSPRPSMASVRETVETRWLFELTSDISPHQSTLIRHQADLVERCDRFIRSFPGSRYAPSALFIKARALDMRVDPGEFRRTKWIRFYDDFPSPASRQAWRVIVENRPDTALGAVALLRLAQIEAREGDVERAIDKLKMLCERFGLAADGSDASESHMGLLKGVLAREVPEASLQIPIERILLEAHRLYDLLTTNRDPLYGYDPIAGSRHRADAFTFGLMDLDPRHDSYIENLTRLRAEYPNCQLEDNIDLEIAKATASQTLGVQRLEACLRQFPDRDQVPEALFRLGVVLTASEQPEGSERVLARLLRDYPSSIWATQAAQHAPWQAASPNVRATSPGSSDETWSGR